MSDLPRGWTRATVGELCKVNPRQFDERPGDDDDVSQVPMAAVEADTGRINASRVVRFGDVKRKSLTPFQENDVLFAKVTPCMENGKIALATGLHGGRGVGSTELFALRSLGGIDPKYLMYFLLQSSVRKDAEHNMTGAVGLRRVPRHYLESLQLPVPPLAEQRRIVSALEEHLARLNAACFSIAGVDERSKALRVSVLDAAASGRLMTSPSSFNDPACFELIASREFRKIDYRLLEYLPPGWRWRVASDVCSVITSGATPEARMMYADQGDVPFLKVYNITQYGQVDFSVRPTFVDHETHNGKLARSRVRPGDVLTNIVGPPLGKTAVVPNLHPEWNINQAIVAFRAGVEVVPEWLALVLQSPFILNRLQSTARATAGQFNIALSTCRELPIPLPPIDEQYAIIARVAEVLSISNAGQSSARTAVEGSKILRSMLLAKAFKGQLVPQDPADESASVILRRIKMGMGTGARPLIKRAVRAPRKTSGIQGDLLS